MNLAALSTGIDIAAFVLGVVSLSLVVIAVFDVARRPEYAMTSGRKTAWIVSMIGGLILFGFVGGIIAAVYLGSARNRLPVVPIHTSVVQDVPPTPTQWIPAAWYPDPSGQSRLRWWDGRSWTEHLQS